MVTKTRDETTGQCTAEMIEVESKNSCNKKIAEMMLQVADQKADTISVIGEGESKISTVM